MYRLAIVASHVIQYQDPFFRLLAAHPQVDLTVLYCSRAGAETYHDTEMRTTLRWDIETLSGYRYRFLRNFGFGEGYTRLVNPGVIPAVTQGRYEAVILFMGWGTVTSLLAIAAARMSGTPFLLYGDSSFPPPVKTVRDRLRAAFVRSVFALAGGFMVSGKLNADYYRAYGADPRTFFLLPWAIDNERFRAAGALGADERRMLRDGLAIPSDRVVLVFSAKLLPRKDPMTLLRAVEMMRARDRVSVLFLGEGELREQLENHAKQGGIDARFAGFINQTELPRYYAVGDVFVLPSLYEPRGAVVNEAMAVGLPIVTTDRCGSIGDIVMEGQNALVYPAGDAAALARVLDELTEDVALRERMARESSRIIATWDYARGVEGVVEALRFLGGRPS